jgi:3-methylcrotonyl-CoA carboxylase alpha subunit
MRRTTSATLSAAIGGTKHTGYFFSDLQGFDLFVEGCYYRVVPPDPLSAEIAEIATGGLVAPMPGTIRALLVEAGDRVTKGQALVILEAMKMEHTIRAPSAGTVRSLNCAQGMMVEAGAVLVEFEPEGG